MSVRERKWTSKHGHVKRHWVARYRHHDGKWRTKAFAKKSDATDYEAKTRVAVKAGVHVADSQTVTISEACDYWLAEGRRLKLEPSTMLQYGQHVNLHIRPFIGTVKLSKLNIGFIRGFSDQLLAEGRSPAMARNVVRTLGGILADAQERNLIASNPIRELSRRRRLRSNGNGNDRRKVQAGVDFPTPDEVSTIIRKAKGLRAQVTVMTLATAGLRASEFRGLRWIDVNLDVGEISVRVRADLYNILGSPKSAKGTRTIPIGPRLTRMLRLWQLQCPKKDGQILYVFPNGNGNIESHSNLRARLWWTAQLDAGVTTTDDEDEVVPRYTGVHSLRHFYASWLINRKKDGGLELPAKVVQERMGHSTIAVTMDRYSHLFPPVNDHDELKRAEVGLLGRSDPCRILATRTPASKSRSA